MLTFKEQMQEAAKVVHQQTAAEQAAAKVKKLAALVARPKLTAEKVVEYLDWIVANAENLGADTALHMAAAELAIRTRSTDAQAKATQHTLVEDGVIAPPPSAS